MASFIKTQPLYNTTTNPMLRILKLITTGLWHWFRRLIAGLPALMRFTASFFAYRRLASPDQRPALRYLCPRLGEDTAETTLDATYFYQDTWAFKLIYQHQPAWHVDVGSHHKYVGLLAQVVPVTMVDLRPLPVTIEGLTFIPGSILDLPFESGSVPSVSSLCVVEHIGLGRYGDPLDPDGTEKAIAELKRIVQPGGMLFLSVPIEDQNRIYFNAHRTFSEAYLLDLFAPFEVMQRSYIYGYQFVHTIQPGRAGTGCYHLRRLSR
jgi:SAM-dependent methyltransferase